MNAPPATPRVSVLLPNLNNRPFLPERLETIFNQTFTDWELIVVDNHSDDGAWELFQDYAAREPRMRISQAPRQGMYANWNNCLRLARGEFCYIATSDDTMTSDCLEKMVAALNAHPTCGICHCSCLMIDEQGREIVGRWESYPQVRYFGDWMNRPHIRKAPHDGLLHCGLHTIYTSITQLLIRRSVFDRVGLFKTQWGSRCDFEWEMRASLLSDTLHLPEKLGSWRRHAAQATQKADPPGITLDMLDMAQSALAFLRQADPALHARLNIPRLLHPYRRQWHVRRIRYARTRAQRVTRSLRFLAAMPASALGAIAHHLVCLFTPRPGHYESRYIRAELHRLGLDDALVPTEVLSSH